MGIYYYLVAGLPDLALDDPAKVYGFSWFVQEMRDHISPEDVPLLNCVCLPVDNANVISLIEAKDDRPFIEGGNFTREELVQQISRPDMVPDYMQTFLEARRENKTLFEDLSPADQLNRLFYEEMLDHQNEFLREWFTFKLNLHNVLVGVNFRKGLAHLDERGPAPGRALASLVINLNGVAEAVLRSSAPDFGLFATLPWIEALLAASKNELVDFEKHVDLLQWDMLDYLTVLSGFGIETILAAAIKVSLVERWSALDPVAGKEKMQALIADLKSGFKIPEEFRETR